MEDRKRLMNAWVAVLSEPAHKPHSYEQLFDSLCFYHLLRLSAPAFFPEEDVLTTNTDGNWVVRKENASALAAAMNRFAVEGLGAKADDFDVRNVIDIVSLAKGSDEALLDLGDLVITFAVLSFTPERKQSMSKLSPDDQKAVSQNVRRCMALYSLKSYKRTASSAVAAASTVVASSGAVGPTTFPSQASGDVGDSGKSSLVSTKVLQDEVASLQRVLAERANAISTLESRLTFVEEEKREVVAKYNTLLAENDAQSRQHTTEQELHQLISKKDAQIRDLNASLNETAEKLNAQKQAVASLETEKEKVKTQLKQTSSQLKTSSTERYSIEQDLKVLQDKFELACKVRNELEDKNDALTSEVSILRAKLEAATPAMRQGGVDDEDDGAHNLSDVDAQAELLQALGRIRHLEAELGMLKRCGFGGAAGGDALDHSSFQADENSRSVNQSLLADSSAVVALEEELARERAAVQEAARDKEAVKQHLGHALVQLNEHKEIVQRLEQENAKLKQQAADVAAAGVAMREAEALKVTLKSQQARFDERRDMANREKAVLVSTMARYSHRNLLLQQRELLAPGATVAAAQQQQQQQQSSGGGALGLVVGLFTGGATTDPAEVQGSFLTKHRRVLERGLLDAACSASRKQ